MMYAVFLRGINTGGMTLLMDDFKHLLEMAGCKHVVTIQAAGTAVFTLEQPIDANRQAEIEMRLSQHMGKQVSLFIKSASEIAIMAELVARQKSSAEYHDYVVIIRENQVYDGVVALHEKIPFMPGERLIRGDGFFIWTIMKGHTLSEFGSRVLGSKKLKEHLTSRNATTLLKIAAKMGLFPAGN